MSTLLSELLDLEKEGLVRSSSQIYPDLYQFKYTDKAVASRFWTPTLKMARGIIVDADSRIVARPFDKFFNLNENEESREDRVFSINGEKVFKEKIDGSCIVSYIHQNKVKLATLGSFNSDQAQYAQQLMNDNLEFLIRNTPQYTHIFEVVYPENRIVVEYPEPYFYYLGSRSVSTGSHHNFSEAISDITNGEVKIPRKVLTYDDVKKEEAVNKEGFVLYIDEIPAAKIKYDWYVKSHRMLDMATHNRVFDLLVQNGLCFDNLDDLNKDIPEHIIVRIDDLISHIRTVSNSCKSRAEDAYHKVKGLSSRKEQAAFLMTPEYKDISSIVFAMLDNKNYLDTFIKVLRKKFE